MGRESRNERQKCEDSNLNVAEPEPQQADHEPEPQQADSDSEPEPDPLPQQTESDHVPQQSDSESDRVPQQSDSESDPVPQQSDSESDPEPQQGAGILQDLHDQDPESQQVDEIPADLQVNPSHDDEIHQNLQVDPVPIQEHEDETVQGGLNIQVEAQQEVLPVEPDSDDQEGVPSFSQESSDEEEETQTGDPPIYQESSKQGVETKTGDPSVSQESPGQEVEQVVTASTSQECPESKVENQAGVPPVSQVSPEQEAETQVEVSSHLQGCPEPQLKIDSTEIQKADGNSVLSIHLSQEMEANMQQRQVRLIDENIVAENKVYSNIVPMISDILRPIFDEAGSENLQQMSQRQNIYIVPMIISFLQQILETGRREILEQTNQNIQPVPFELRTSLEGAGSEISQQRHQIIVPTTSTPRSWSETLQQMNSILPICFEFLLSREEFQTEILFQILFSTLVQTRFMHCNLIHIDPAVIIHREFTAYHRIRILLLLFSIQFRTTPRLLPVVPLISLSALVASAPLLALRGLRHLLGLVDIRNLPALEGPDLPAAEPTQELSSRGYFPLLSFSESPPFSSSPQSHQNLSEAEMCSRLQKRKDVELRELSEISSEHPSEVAEVLAVCPRKPKKARAKRHRKRTESSERGYADTTLHPFEYQELEYGNEDFSDPGEPDISDPIDLLKDLNFPEMKGVKGEMELTVNLEPESIDGWETETEKDLKTEASEDIETEITENGGDLNTEASGDLETEGSEDIKTKAKGDLEANDDEDLETSDDKDLEISGEDLESDDDEGLEMENHTDAGVAECQLLLPNAEQLPHEDIIEIPDDAEEASSNASFPNEEGNSVSFRNETCCEAEAGHEEFIEQAGGRCEKIEILGYCFWLIFFVAVVIYIYFALKHDRKGFR